MNVRRVAMDGPEAVDEAGWAAGGAWRGGCIKGCSDGFSDAEEELIAVGEPGGGAVGAGISYSLVASFLIQNFWLAK